MTLLEINHKIIEDPSYDAEAFRVLDGQEPEMAVLALLCDAADHGDARKAMPRFSARPSPSAWPTAT